MFRSRGFSNLVLSVSVLCLGAVPAAAQDGDSNAFGEEVDLTVVGAASVTSGPLPVAAGSGPADYTDSDTAASASVTLLAVEVLSTGVLDVNASGAFGAPSTVDADATVDGVDIDLFGVFTLAATEVAALAEVTGTCGQTLAPSGDSVLTGITASSTIGTVVGVSANPAPNTEILNVPGLRVVLNEQFFAGDGLGMQRIVVNAIHVYANDLQIAGLPGPLTGEIVISHAEANLDCSESDTQADLELTISDDPDPVMVGDNFTKTLEVFNAGPDTATDLVLQDFLPSGVSFVSASSPSFTCSEAGGTVTCTLASLAANQTATVQIVVTAEAEGTLVNTATVSSAVSDPDPSDNSATEATTALALVPAMRGELLAILGLLLAGVAARLLRRG